MRIAPLTSDRVLWGLVIACVASLLVGRAAAAPITAAKLKDKPDDWFKTDEAKPIIDHVIAWQLPSGGWFKGYDASTEPREVKADNGLGYDAKADPWIGIGTFDNGLTYSEIRFLARAYNATKRQDALDAVNKGLDFIFKSQYDNGGWPQRYPLPEGSTGYGRDITLNDTAMINVMELLEDVIEKDEPFGFVDDARRQSAKRAFDKGVDCLVKLQVVVNGTPTVWAQQYDQNTLQPAKARAYELPGLSGDESASATSLLMRIKDPSPEVKRAIHNAVAWFERSKVTGIKVQRKEDKSLPKGFDVTAVEDPAAPPLWARYYEIDTNRPFYSGRDGVKKYSMNEIEPERRAGYAWLRPWGEKILRDYPKWCKKNGETPVVEVHPTPTTQTSDAQR